MYEGTLARVSNRATWIDDVEIRDDDSGDLIDLSTATEITLQVKQCGSTRLTATLTDATIVVTDLGVFRFTITAEQMGGLCADTYDVGVTIETANETTQILIGRLPIIEGMVN